MRACVAALTVTAVFLGVSLAFAQQGSGPTPEKYRRGDTYQELSKAPDKARAKQNPLAGDTDAVRAGRNLFEQHCGECHGDSGEGGRRGPSLRVAEVQNATPGTIFWVLTNGVVRRGMPVWSKLPEPQRWQLVSYIKSLSTEPALPPSAPGPNAGSKP